MKIKIRKPVTGSEDGVKNIEFKPGQVVEVNEALTKSLLAGGWAVEHVEDDAPATGADTVTGDRIADEGDTAEPETMTHTDANAKAYGIKVDGPDQIKAGAGKAKKAKASDE